MSSRNYFLLSIFTVAVVTCAAHAVTLKPLSLDNEFVHQQFGDSCSVESAWQPMVADLNNDGVDDLVVVARCKNPLVDQGENNYQVIDPMDSFYGYGNPTITTGFAPDDPKLRGLCLLVIHGSGPEAWRSSTPLAKYVIINIPVKTFSVKHMRLRHNKPANGIFVEEAGADRMTSVIFWDGKKYRYTPLGSSME